MSVITGALINGGIKLLGGLFGSRSAKKAEARARQNFLNSGADTREAAVRGGFNPLTFLQATGGGAAANGGFSAAGQPAALASQELIMGGLQDFGSVLSGEAAQQQRERELSYNLAKLEYEKSAASRIGAAAGSGFSTARRAAMQIESEGQVIGYGGGAPPRRPTAKNEGRISVFAPNGKTLLVPAGIAERLNIKPWQNMAMGEYTELVGELRGEGEGLVDLGLEVGGGGGIQQNLTGGDVYTAPGAGGARPAGPVPGYMPPAKKKPTSFWSYFGHSF